MNQHLLRCLGAAALAACATAAPAHVTLEYRVAPAGSHYKATFQVGHGCGDAPTRQISIAIPPGVAGARPMPKPGWTVDIRRGTLAQPVTSHGHTVTEGVVRVTWTARTPADMLPGDQFDEFVLMAQLPREPGTVHWPVTQLCEPGRSDWVDIPKPGQSAADLKTPAPALEILPAAGGHQH
ncbi:MAG TPA: YcnI family protein [Ramlibacter sp.]|jgi:uncharacterized protein YcnI|uniref:YcnI family copper-binding membrane protein n=1 Tax=Ramlibacter sp. TaxID=1917967 RepID=UPI002D5DFF3C|nr:YcnI family protein [Ramlibacter sp.]HZY17060.1 YcnI family protein [Ramlibacter sp.]